ncbi:methyltransferase family protein [Piscinibacter koreensis]|uniref:Isoprenylcysteine carboxylmethyltransferase family protein n=1 Tax=Piscinibacter koreensis TaxID=2742824 RepID=A0A7Y6NPY1_9BURK|nr:isoprenylcysteine carboxylmethyltransferase family protein [Schlegelella koreensis]NUZ07195.1 isoprenylcysteine carboxylmethyltransferase family protein [Schlegelella koreensis]
MASGSRGLELRVPPLLVVLVAAAAMAGITRVAPMFDVAIAAGWRSALAALLLALGIGFAVAGVVAFRRANTTVDPIRPDAASALVAVGVYRVSRNPMYVGFVLALAAWAVWLANALAVVVLPLFVAYLDRFQIVPEERALGARFGASYDAYLRRVRRWL